MLDLTKLNQDQSKAVENTQGPLLVLAGAGTGKTTVITYKIAYLIERGFYDADNILAVTFTNKAAAQMQQRVQALSQRRLQYIGTFHSIALRMLRNDAELVGLRSDLNVLDYADQLKMLKNIYTDYKLDNNKLEHKSAHYIITAWKDLNLLPEQVQSKNQMALDIYHYYQQYLKNSNLVDFSDIIMYVNNILATHPEVLKRYRQQFAYVLVDEYQDTNSAQYQWIKLIASEHKNICCVGDDDQSIYSWRGAQISNILNFGQEFEGTQIITLSQNYRSTQNILDVAQSIIANNANRYDKKLVSGKDADFEQRLVTLIECQNVQDEAEFIAQEFMKINDQDTAAVLVRTNFQTRILEEVFIRHQVPYTIVGSMKFYELKEIKDAIGYIRASVNNHDDVAIERIINTPKRAIGAATLANIRQHALGQQKSLFSSICDLLAQKEFTKKVTHELEIFIEGLTRWGKYLQSMEPAIAVQKILDESGYMQMMNKNIFELPKLDNIKELIKAIGDHANIAEFIDYISLISTKDDSTSYDQLKSSIKIMTIHAAKGLEFDTVFLPNWMDGILPSSKSLFDETSNALEEERRIAYVGITRAKTKLSISCSAYARSKENYYVQQEPSRFLAEIHPSMLAKGRYPQISVSNSMYPGSRVMHKVFGYGLIVRLIDNDKYEVGFKHNGLKTIHRDFLQVV